MKKYFLVLFFLFFTASAAHAANYQIKVNEIHCEKCVKKIHDYFVKHLGNRVQNLKIDMDADTVTFDSISVDTIELDNIRKGLEMMGFKVTQVETKPTVNEKKV